MNSATGRTGFLRASSRLLYWTAPCLLCLWVFWYGLRVWFYQDDFAWLGLGLNIYDTESFLRSLFAPMAQGTIRPWSERGFFLLFHWLFGLEALPYRIWVFLTMFACLFLVGVVTTRLSGSRAAGFWASVFWASNSALSIPLSWTSAYNQVLCAFFLLLAFYWLLRNIETGERKYLLLQWLTFLLGFGALELNVVYPAIAAAYTLLCARPHFLRSLWLFLPSLLYTWVHRAAAARPSEGVYALYLDADLPRTIWTYVAWAAGALRPAFHMATLEWAVTVSVAAWAGLLVFLAAGLWRRRWGVLFPAAWFLITLGPYLPLKLHKTDYYLVSPTAGLAMLGGWALTAAWRAGWLCRPAAILVALLYLAGTIPVSRSYAKWNYDRSQPVKRLFYAVQQARELHPGKTLLLTGVSSELFWAGVFDSPFRLIGIRDVYLVPGSEDTITAHPELGEVRDFVLPPVATLKALAERRAVVYAAGSDKLRNVTELYQAIVARQLTAELAQRVDVGQPLLADQLGPGWYPIEYGFRWMGKKASLRLGGPRTAGQKLYIQGYCPERQMRENSLVIAVRVNGGLAGEGRIDRAGTFDLVFPLSAQLVGSPSMEVEIEISRVDVPPEDGRELGAAFGVFAVR